MFPRLYAILDVEIATARGLAPLSIVEAWLSAGVRLIQLRAKTLPTGAMVGLAEQVAACCRQSGARFIVNDRVDVALESGAAGAHVGQADDPQRARRRLGSNRVLGVSVGDVGEAVAAEHVGADYLGVTVWSTSTKPEAEGRGLDGLRDVVAATALPVVGIGGIDVGNAGLVLDTGAVGVAVISAVAAAVDPVLVTRSLADIVDRHRAGQGAAR